MINGGSLKNSKVNIKDMLHTCTLTSKPMSSTYFHHNAGYMEIRVVEFSNGGYKIRVLDKRRAVKSAKI